MPVEAEALPEQWLEVLGQEVGEEQSTEFFFVHRRELLGAAEELVAVRARQPGRLGMAFEQRIESAPGAAVGVGDEHGATLRRGLFEQRLELGHDALWAIVQVCGQVGDLHRVGEPLGFQHRAQL